MKVSLKWLKEYLQTTASASELADKMTMVGLEVEELIDNSLLLKDFKVAEVRSVENHPNADRLHVLKVFDGKEELQIVCGAPNVYKGMKSVLAHEGTIIPAYNEKLKKGNIRGVESCGMLCSEKEIGVGTDHSGIIDLKTNLPAGTDITEVFGADSLFDVNVYANRGDCFGIKGIARDIAAAGAGTFLEKKHQTKAGNFKSPVNVTIKNPACSQFVLRYIKGVKNCESPQWLKERLQSVGLHPISALVDITNYLNIGEARPLHVFDADKIKGNLVVRAATDGEKISCIDDKEYTLQSDMLVVADDERPLSVAGIMGGADTAVSMDTVNVVLESAYFDPISVATTGRKLNCESDSRTRFERGVDPTSQISGSDYATNLILDICGGEVSEIVIAGKEPDWKRIIEFDYNLSEKICGIKIEQDVMKAILMALGFEVQGKNISVPSWRSNDVRLPQDLVEEIIRIYGTDKLQTTPVYADKLVDGIMLPLQKKEAFLRRVLAMQGLNQALTYSFTDSEIAKHFDSKGVLLANPISVNLNEMRPNILPNLLMALKRNQDRAISDVALFEVGPVFFGSTPFMQQPVAGGVRAGAATELSWTEKQRPVDVFDVKEDVIQALKALSCPQPQLCTGAADWYHPGQSGTFRLGKNVIAYFGAIHPRILKALGIKTQVYAFEIFVEAIPEARKKNLKSLKLSNLMPLSRDFAFVLDKAEPADKLVQTIRNVDKEKITDVIVFDVYSGEHLPADKKSIAIKVVIQPTEKTLTDEEINAICTQIITVAQTKANAVLRR